MTATAQDDTTTTTGPATEAKIAQRAYEIFLARGARHGQDIEDWLQAERELHAPENGSGSPQ